MTDENPPVFAIIPALPGFRVIEACWDYKPDNTRVVEELLEIPILAWRMETSELKTVTYDKDGRRRIVTELITTAMPITSEGCRTADDPLILRYPDGTYDAPFDGRFDGPAEIIAYIEREDARIRAQRKAEREAKAAEDAA